MITTKRQKVLNNKCNLQDNLTQKYRNWTGRLMNTIALLRNFVTSNNNALFYLSNA